GVDAVNLRPASFELRHFQLAFLVGNGRHMAVFDDQTARRNERREFCIAKLAQQSPDVAVDGFGPDSLTRVEVTANQRSVDARIHGSRVKCNQSTLAVTGHANLPFAAALSLEPVHSGQHFLDLVADDVPAHVKRLTVDPLPVGLVRYANLRIS